MEIKDRGVRLSIIIPVYNVSKYLNECLKSLIEKNRQDYEIILVNDGSTDNSAYICEQYSREYEQIQFYSKENSGVSDTRNMGIDLSNGEYLAFIDADDYVENGYIDKIISLLDYKADIYIYGYYEQNEKGIFKKEVTRRKSGMQEMNSAICENIFSELHYQVWNKIFKAEIVKEKGIKFDSNLRISEDLKFWVDYFYYISNLYILDKPIYYYRYNENGAVRKKSLDVFKQIDTVFKAQKRLLFFLNVSEQAHLQLNTIYVEHICLYYHMLRQSRISSREIDLHLNQILKEVPRSLNKKSAKFKAYCLIHRNYLLLDIYFLFRYSIKKRKKHE